jgi:predicted alpha/beta superfamily hydrolase
LLPAKADALDSAVLKQKRSIEVYLPEESAKEPAQRYETLYVLDGDWNAKIVVDTVTFMRKVGFLPPVIVVSVPNFFDEHGVNSRDHDLTPTVVSDQPRSGGAADFLAFLKTELIPYVNQHYPTSGVNLIHGHSFGGLFLFYVLMNDPSVFDGYLILDPAMWWDKHALDALIDDKLPALPSKGKAIYIAARSGRAFEGMGMSTIEPIFKRKAPADLHWSVSVYANETHDSLKLKGTYDALKFAYQGYTADTIELMPSAGIVIKGKPMLVGINGDALDLHLDLHYTTDGTVPNASSPKYDGSIAMADPEKTTVKLFSNRGTFDRVVPHRLKSGKALAPARAANGKNDAWHVAYYPAEAWPNLKRAKPFKSVDVDKDLDFAEAGRDSFAGTVERNLDIPADGYYVVGVFMRDKARVSLTGLQLFDHDGSHGGYQQGFVVPLRRGTYPVRVEFQHASKTSDFGLIVFQCKDGEPEWWKNELFKLFGRTHD